MPDWKRSSFCGGGGNNCVELAVYNDGIAIRDSVHPARIIKISKTTLATFIAGVRAGAMDN